MTLSPAMSFKHLKIVVVGDGVRTLTARACML